MDKPMREYQMPVPVAEECINIGQIVYADNYPGVEFLITNIALGRNVMSTGIHSPYVAAVTAKPVQSTEDDLITLTQCAEHWQLR